jgi:exonuclease 3'-5' domain-containing protein 1
MSILPLQQDPTIVDSIPILILLLDKLVDIPVEPLSLNFDLEGINLGRHGSISVVSLYLRPLETVYLVHIYILGSAAFSTTHSRVSLKGILESATIPKVFFDIVNDSDALFINYQISVEGINDLQLMVLATRNYSRTYVAGPARCIEQDSNMSSEVKVEWRRAKESAGRRFKPEEGGKYEVFNNHPLKPDIIQYCAWDVALLLDFGVSIPLHGNIGNCATPAHVAFQRPRCAGTLCFVVDRFSAFSDE